MRAVPPEADSDVTQEPQAGTLRVHGASFVLGMLLATLIAGSLFFLARRPEPAPIVLHPPPTPAPTATISPTATPPPIVVHVSGAVAQPGLYTLATDARVGDALQSAGGLADHAAGETINQAERLWDGAQVHVHSRNDLQSNGAELEPPSGVSGVPLTPPASNGDATAGNRGAGVNLNSATPSELESLPGIGPVLAAAIIADRPYASVEEITRVSGIGDSTLADLRDLVTVD